MCEQSLLDIGKWSGVGGPHPSICFSEKVKLVLICVSMVIRKLNVKGF